MQSSKRPLLKFFLPAAMLLICLAAVIFAQTAPPDAAAPTPLPAINAATTNASGTNAAAAPTNAPAGTNSPAPEPKKLPTDMIQLSFQNMQIDQVIQWLSENTGKSVVKHPSVHSQVTIISTKKVTRSEAVTMVYRALDMEGFTAIETDTSILIVPTDQESKLSLSPQLSTTTNALPGGHQRLVRVFPLKHLPAADITEKVKTVLSKEAVVVTDDRANVLIITDYNDNLAVAAALIGALDVEKNEDVIVRAIPLKTVNATEVVKQLQPLYQKLTGRQSRELIEVSASETGNNIMVLSSAANFKEIQSLVNSLDTQDAQDKIMRTFELKNADAEDVAKQLTDLSKDSDNSGGPYRMFFYGGGGGGGSSKKLSFVADRRRNAIVVQGPPSVMEGISNTIAALDLPVNDNSLAPKIVPIENVSAGDVEDVLNDLFLKKTTQRSYYWDDTPPEPDKNVGRLYGKVRVSSEAAANALIITANSQENLDAVIAIVKELDKPSSAGDTTYHVRLKFGNAQKIANRINILFAKNGSQALRPVNQPNANGANSQPQQPQNTGTQTTPSADDFSLEQVVKEDPYYSWLGGAPDVTGRNGSSSSSTERPVSDLVGHVRVVPDEASSSLLVTANVHLYTQVSKMIEDMDVPPPQVLIDARLVQISANYLDQIGVRYSPNGGEVFSGNDYQNSLMPHLGGTYTKGFGGNTTVNNAGSGSTLTGSGITEALTSMRSGVLDGTISMDFLIQFLQQKADATIVSEPQLTISDNDMGKLFVGQSVPIVTGSVNPSLGGSSATFTYRNVGVIVEVEPHINDAGDVQLRVRAESSTLDPVLIGSNAVIDSAQFRTEVTAKAGQTLVLGGIMQNQTTDNIYKTPILGDIPGLKYLFSKHDKSIKKTELLVFLRPKVVRTPEQARLLLEESRKSMQMIYDWEKKEDKRLNQDKPPTQ